MVDFLRGDDKRTLELFNNKAKRDLNDVELKVLKAFMKYVYPLADKSKLDLMNAFIMFTKEVGLKKDYSHDEIRDFLVKHNYNQKVVHLLRKFGEFLGYVPQYHKDYPLFMSKYHQFGFKNRKPYPVPNNEEIAWLYNFAVYYGQSKDFEKYLFSLYMRLIIETGMRMSEPFSITIDSFEVRGNVPTIMVKGKGSKFRTVVISVELYEALMMYAIKYGHVHRKDEPLFMAMVKKETSIKNDVDKLYKQFCRIANECYAVEKGKDPRNVEMFVVYREREVKKLRKDGTVSIRKERSFKPRFRMHAYRSYFAQKMHYENGVKVMHIMEMLGHSSIGTTQVYLKQRNDEVLNTWNKYINKNLKPKDLSEVKAYDKLKEKLLHEGDVSLSDKTEILGKESDGLTDFLRQKIKENPEYEKIIKESISPQEAERRIKDLEFMEEQFLLDHPEEEKKIEVQQKVETSIKEYDKNLEDLAELEDDKIKEELEELEIDPEVD